MRSIKRIAATILVLALLFVSVNAENTYTLYFDASLNLETGETTYTPTEIDEENDYSDLWVEVTKITPDGTATPYYTGLLGNYDDGRWVHMDLTKPLMLCDWQTKNSYWVVPTQVPDETEQQINSNDAASTLNMDGNLMSASSELSITSQIKINGVNVGENGLRIIDNANMECTLSVSNSSSENSGLTALLATYNSYGKLHNVTSFDIDVDAGETITTEINYQFDSENETTGKIMFWDSMTTLLPICASIDFSQTSGANAYYYDADNRLLQVDKTNGTSILFTYDKMGNLLTRTTRK